MHGNKDDLYKLQKRKRKQHSKQHAHFYVRAYTMEHMLLLQTSFGYWFGIGARIPFPKPHTTKVDEPGNSFTTDILLNIITDISSTSYFGPKNTPFNTQGINGFALVYDQESYELTINVRYGSLNYIEANEIGMLSSRLWHKSSTNISWMLSKMGTLFPFGNEYWKTDEEYKGQEKILCLSVRRKDRREKMNVSGVVQAILVAASPRRK
jgi:hypothetical protein